MHQNRRQRAPGGITPAAGRTLNARNRWRRRLDRVTAGIIPLGGIGVIVTLLLLFVFLVHEVAPLFLPAGIALQGEFVLADGADGQTLHLAIEEQATLGLRLSDNGTATFFRLPDGALIHTETLPVPAADTISSFATAAGSSDLLALGLTSGKVLLLTDEYRSGFSGADNQRTVTPRLHYPLGAEPIALGDGASLLRLALARRDHVLVLAALDASQRIHLLRASRQRNLMAAFDTADEAAYTLQFASLPAPLAGVRQILIDGDLRRLLVLSAGGQLTAFAMDQVFAGTATGSALALPPAATGATLTEWLAGGLSLLLTDAGGSVHQFFFTDASPASPPVLVRSFRAATQPVTMLAAEQRRKNFFSMDQQGWLRAFNTTANRETFSARVAEAAPLAMTVAPRGNRLLLETAPGRFSLWRIDNPHPEVSWSALWNEVWYEGYAVPDHIWQSSGTDNAFEPKYSLLPLSFGTLKAALYAMLLAAPLAVCGAIHTGYFMAAPLRRKVKPAIELMEALPTVVLGFLAGLWLAPLLEQHLLGAGITLLLLPLSILLTSLGWYLLPKPVRHSLPEGWEAVLLIPVVLGNGWLAFSVAGPLEAAWFGGDLRGWLDTELGISYHQRNALVVGFAMGFAVIPTVFSIAEDAIFTVPRHLPYGSLALGATPWQSLYHVVLPAASPGIFSALMIGLGRAVGETMIVLMATGNTPIMDFDPLTGMRTLAANIAIEIPESAVDSSHYRILLLTALVLFLFTFLINSIAEVVRQRLRHRYELL